MAVAKSTEELERQILAEMSKAMTAVSKQLHRDMQWGTQFFYAGTKPKIYVRTGALGESPTVSHIQPMTNGFAFIAYLSPMHRYTTGDYPTMTQVLNLANSGIAWRTKSGALAKDTVGHKHFWEKSKKVMEHDFYEIMSRHFH